LRFTLIKDISKDNSMKPILNGLLFFTLLYIVVDIFVKKSSFGLFVVDIKTTLYGNMDEFLDPMTESTFLEFIHTEIFFLMMILLTLSAVFTRLSKKNPFSITIINILMISGLATLLFLGLAYFINAEFIALYVISFFLWHIVALYMTLYSLWTLNFAKSI